MIFIQLFFMSAWLAIAWAEGGEEEIDQAVEMQTTLGQLCKTADFVGICSLLHVETNNELNVLTWKIEKSIAGSAPTNMTISVEDQMPTCRSRTKDERCLVFWSQTLFPLTQGTNANLAVFQWDFSREGVGVRTNEWKLVGGPRGIIPMKEHTENVVLQTVTGYWSHLRNPSRNIDDYYAFLRDQQNSNVKRIRSDVRLDLRILMRFAEVDSLRRITRDEGLDEDLKAHAIKLLKWKESRTK